MHTTMTTRRQRVTGQPLYEQYRPQAFWELVGQPDAVRAIGALAARGLAGRAYWISGLSGVGKTTIARLLAGEVADELNTEEIDSKLLTASRLAEIERASACLRIGEKPGAAHIVNEAHGLSKSVILQLLTTLERIPTHVVWVFTTTKDGQAKLFDEQVDAHPLLSRCHVLPLSADVHDAFARRVYDIAQREGLCDQPMEAAIRLVGECRGNMRAALQQVEAGRLM